jgi:hypothetical protein
MTLVLDLVTEAFRENNITPIGTALKTAELAEGLSLFNQHVRGVFGLVVGITLQDWPVPLYQRVGAISSNPPLLPNSRRNTNYVLDANYPPGNARLVWDGTEQTVYLPDRPQDGARMALVKASGAAATTAGVLTLNGNGRTIEGANTYVLGEAREWFYEADSADWKALITFTGSDECPFPPGLDEYWITAMAVRLAPRYDKVISAATQATWKRMLTTITGRYAQVVPAISGADDLVASYESYWQPGACDI